jgi:hypothetical protein
MSEQALAWVLLVTWGIWSLLALGYYGLAGETQPWRPLWYRIGGAICEVVFVWLALRVVAS